MKALVTALCLAALCAHAPTIAESDARERVELPDPMRQHMLANMRDHLAALQEIQAALAQGQFDRAGEIAEQRLGMSSLIAHHAAHMAPHMPKGMQDIGAEMHAAASRFARTAQEGDLASALSGLAQVTRQCVACHAAYRVR